MGMAPHPVLLSVHQGLVLMHCSTANHRQRSQPARLQRPTTCVVVGAKGARKHFTHSKNMLTDIVVSRHFKKEK
jgi:hypothetical protein